MCGGVPLIWTGGETDVADRPRSDATSGNSGVISPFRLRSQESGCPQSLGITGPSNNRLHMVATDSRFYQSLPRRATTGALASLNSNPYVHL